MWDLEEGVGFGGGVGFFFNLIFQYCSFNCSNIPPVLKTHRKNAFLILRQFVDKSFKQEVPEDLGVCGTDEYCEEEHHAVILII